MIKEDGEESPRRERVKGRGRNKRKERPADVEMGVMKDDQKQKKNAPPLKVGFSGREQNMPADAVLNRDNANQVRPTSPSLKWRAHAWYSSCRASTRP